MRLPEAHPRRSAVDKSIAHRLGKDSFRKLAVNLTNSLPISNSPRAPLDTSVPFPEEDVTEENWTVYPNQDVKSSIDELESRIEGIGADLYVYTDGSCTDGTTKGGAAAVITDGPFSNPNCIAIKKLKGNLHTCSYEEEKRALILGIDWLRDHPGYRQVAFCTDSLSLLQAIESHNPDTLTIRTQLPYVCDHAHLMYVQGHANIPGNELADTYAKQATRLPGVQDSSIPLRTARTIIHKKIRDRPTTHHLGKKFYPSVRQDRDDVECKSRRQAVLLAQIRSGHHKELGYYSNLIDPTESAVCNHCVSGEIDDTEHWLTSCSSTKDARLEIFGSENIDMVELARAPSKIIKLAEETLVGRAAMQG